MGDDVNGAGPDGAFGKAFAVTCAGFAPGIYFATSASKAKIAALVQARDAGYVSTRFADLRVRRAPEFDGATYCGKTPKHGVVPDCLVLP
jgi:hypothetical protein